MLIFEGESSVSIFDFFLAAITTCQWGQVDEHGRKKTSPNTPKTILMNAYSTRREDKVLDENGQTEIRVFMCTHWLSKSKSSEVGF